MDARADGRRTIYKTAAKFCQTRLFASGHTDCIQKITDGFLWVVERRRYLGLKSKGLIASDDNSGYLCIKYALVSVTAILQE